MHGTRAGLCRRNGSRTSKGNEPGHGTPDGGIDRPGAGIRRSGATDPRLLDGFHEPVRNCAKAATALDRRAAVRIGQRAPIRAADLSVTRQDGRAAKRMLRPRQCLDLKGWEFTEDKTEPLSDFNVTNLFLFRFQTEGPGEVGAPIRHEVIGRWSQFVNRTLNRKVRVL